MKANSFKSQKSLFLKLGFILLLTILLLIPLAMVQSLINERQSLEYQVQSEIAAGWGPEQKVVGPILSIPYTIIYQDQDDKAKYLSQTLRVLPKEVDLDVNMDIEKRKKSIYEAILYSANHNLKAKFTLPSLTAFGDKVHHISWDLATIDMGFMSSSSLTSIVEVVWNDEAYPMKSGASDPALFRSGIHATIAINPEKEIQEMTCKFQLNGSRNIKYLPTADKATIKMKSSWNAPGFIGLPLPQKHEITDDGFEANWQTTEYNRSFKSTWQNNSVQLDHLANGPGVDLVQTVSHYQKNMRSAKYALLIISLSFLIFFFFELLKGKKIHPIQYTFVGLSLSIFYLLLLSISEYLGFNKAYLMASLSVITLIGWYTSKVLRVRKDAWILIAMLTALYGYVYTLLQMEEYALLVGSVGLFFILGLVMYISRNLDWYSISDQQKD